MVAPVGAGRTAEETYNINGDTAAGAVAGAMQAERLMLLTDVSRREEQGWRRADAELTREDVANLIADGTIAGGMIPKVETAVAAMDQGCGASVILDGTVPHGVLLELFTEHGAGTLIIG